MPANSRCFVPSKRNKLAPMIGSAGKPEPCFTRSAATTLTAALIAGLLFGCSPFGPSRERAISDAISQVKETMDVALPDVPHPEPYRYQDAGDCAWVPEMPSSKETLRYQVEVPLPVGDDGLERQAKAVRHWVDKGGEIRVLPYDTGRPPVEVNYRGGSILAFAMPTRGGKDPNLSTFYIVATTPCIAKEER